MRRVTTGLLVLTLFTAGCTSAQERGTAIGAGVGTGAGALVTGTLEGAAVGGIIGGSAGYLLSDPHRRGEH